MRLASPGPITLGTSLLLLSSFLAGGYSIFSGRAAAQTPPAAESQVPDSLPEPPSQPLEQTFPEENQPPLLTPGVLDRVLGVESDPDFESYRLGPGDTFFVSVQRFPDLSFQATLDIQGNVIVPIEGAVSFEGLTLEQARAKIYGIYDKYVFLTPSDVSLTLTAQRGVEVTILGEVARPGFYPLQAPQVTAALLSAGGSTTMADLRSVRIMRRLDNGETIETSVDLFTPLKDGDPLPEVRLQHGDVVVIPRLDPGRLDDYDRTLVAQSTLAQPTIDIRVLNYAQGARGNQGGLFTVTLPNGSRFTDIVTRLAINPDRTKLSEIALVRFDPEQGQAVTNLLDAKAALEGDISQNVPLQNNDVIIVERNLIARITNALGNFTQPFRDVLGFLLFFDSLADSAENLFGPGDDD